MSVLKVEEIPNVLVLVSEITRGENNCGWTNQDR